MVNVMAPSSKVARSPIFYGRSHISADFPSPGRKLSGRPNLPYMNRQPGGIRVFQTLSRLKLQCFLA